MVEMTKRRMRKFTPYETNQLIKHGHDPIELQTDTDSSIPVEYITGMAEFYSRDFQVNQNVLIPRVETEQIIDLGLEFVENRARKYDKITFADIGTGSGAIGITFALELEKRLIPYEGYMSDLSKSALEIAEKNAKQFLSERNLHCFVNQRDASMLQVIESNLTESYPKDTKLDIVFANLPYIPSARISALDVSVKDFEPVTALDGRVDGLSLIRLLLSQIEAFIDRGSIVLLEVDDTHTIEKTLEFENYQIDVLTDQFGKNRFWRCILL